MLLDELKSKISKIIIKLNLNQKFNYFKNNQSYAHDNDILNEAEPLLIFRHFEMYLKLSKHLRNNINKKLCLILIIQRIN